MKTFSLAVVSCFGLLVGCGPAPAKVTVSFANAAAVDALQPKVGSIEVRAYKVKTSKYKGVDGITLNPRVLSCDDGDYTNPDEAVAAASSPDQWKFAKEVTTVTDGTILKGTSGKVDVFANNEDVIFEIVAQEGVKGDGAVYGKGCAVLPGVKSGANMAVTVNFCPPGTTVNGYNCPTE